MEHVVQVSRELPGEPVNFAAVRKFEAQETRSQQFLKEPKPESPEQKAVAGIQNIGNSFFSFLSG